MAPKPAQGWGQTSRQWWWHGHRDWGQGWGTSRSPHWSQWGCRRWVTVLWRQFSGRNLPAPARFPSRRVGSLPGTEVKPHGHEKLCRTFLPAAGPEPRWRRRAGGRRDNAGVRCHSQSHSYVPDPSSGCAGKENTGKSAAHAVPKDWGGGLPSQTAGASALPPGWQRPRGRADTPGVRSLPVPATPRFPSAKKIPLCQKKKKKT